MVLSASSVVSLSSYGSAWRLRATADVDGPSAPSCLCRAPARTTPLAAVVGPLVVAAVEPAAVSLLPNVGIMVGGCGGGRPGCARRSEPQFALLVLRRIAHAP
jgi:hypothetical protein